ncbi:MAG: hypothetical protein PHQ11_05320 [Paludibacter sp.]|nr:hypothetical protein [Paludibacter sp.]
MKKDETCFQEVLPGGASGRGASGRPAELRGAKDVMQYERC